MFEYLAWGFMALGAFFMVTGSVGMLRMPDFYTRLHPAGVTDSLGAPLVLLGLVILGGLTLFSGKVVLLMLFLMLTGPTSTHLVAKSAMVCGLKPFIKEKKE